MKKFIFLIILSFTLINAKTIELSSSIISDNEKSISSRFIGFIKKVNVKEGQSVKKGMILYEIDSQDIDTKKEQALLSLQIAKNQFINNKLNYNRYKRLYKKDLVSKFDLEQLELNYNNMKDNITIIESKIKEINNKYKYLNIKAPNDGIIIKKNINVGEIAMPGRVSLILSDFSDLKIKAEITQSDLTSVFIGKEVQILIDSINQRNSGKILSIIPNTNPMTHTFILKISLAKINNLYPGMYAKIIINTKE